MLVDLLFSFCGQLNIILNNFVILSFKGGLQCCAAALFPSKDWELSEFESALSVTQDWVSHSPGMEDGNICPF